MTRYTTAHLHAMPDDTGLRDAACVVWKPYFWQGKRTKGWITGKDGDFSREYKSASKLAKLNLEEL